MLVIGRFEKLEDLYNQKTNAIVRYAQKIYKHADKKVRILDIATGPNNYNLKILSALKEKNIPYEMILSDISPKHFHLGYEHIAKDMPEQLENITCVLADSRDLRKDITEVLIWGEPRKTLQEVLQNPENQFLLKGYDNSKRKITFEDEAFDIITGCISYGSINTGDYKDAIKESARVLKKGGVHIISELEVKKINYNAIRTENSIKLAKCFNTEDVKSELDKYLKHEETYMTFFEMKRDEGMSEQAVQKGDQMKATILVHLKK